MGRPTKPLTQVGGLPLTSAWVVTATNSESHQADPEE